MKLFLKITVILLLIGQKYYYQNLPEQLQNKLELLQQSYFFDLDVNPSELASGIYFYLLRTITGFSETNKLTLIK